VGGCLALRYWRGSAGAGVQFGRDSANRNRIIVADLPRQSIISTVSLQLRTQGKPTP
jgi:hypothetical protein